MGRVREGTRVVGGKKGKKKTTTNKHKEKYNMLLNKRIRCMGTERLLSLLRSVHLTGSIFPGIYYIDIKPSLREKKCNSCTKHSIFAIIAVKF